MDRLTSCAVSLSILLGIGASPLVAHAAVPGVTDNSIVLGQSAAFSGPAARLGQSMREGLNVYFARINAEGGVNGRRIELVSLDDGYEPDRAVPNTQRLISQDKVFALIGYVGTPTSYAVIPTVSQAQVPFLGAFTGAEGLRSPFNRYIFNVRASYFDETERLVEFLVSQRKKKIAVFYQNDSYGKAGLEGVKRAMERRNLTIAALGTVERNTVEVDQAVKRISASTPDGIIMISAYKSCAAFVKGMNKTGQAPDYLNVSFVGSEALAGELGTEGHGVMISQVVPYPWDPSSSIAMEFSRDIARVAPEVKPSFNNLEGYIVAKTFVEALQRAGKDLTREKLITALESMKQIDFGGFNLSFSPTNHNGSQYVGLTLIVGSKGGFLPVLEDARLARSRSGGMGAVAAARNAPDTSDLRKAALRGAPPR
ncbi:MAG: ABC transporter substrate-binding protein [Pseudomonadota bacterium]|nr:MAG: ABC transporter substrate-binding protein [Pseudomonadota bacterium]